MGGRLARRSRPCKENDTPPSGRRDTGVEWSEAANAELLPLPALWAYYEHGRTAGFAARYLCAKRTPWYAQENRLPTEFLCTYIGRSDSRTGRPFRFILNHSQAIAANVYLMLYPRPALAEALRQDPRLGRILWQKLNQLDASAITREGRVYGGGLHKVEPSELANVPVNEIAGLIGTPQPASSEQLILCDGR